VLTSEVEAQVSRPPRRLVFFLTANGTIRRNWLPSGDVDRFELSRILQPLAEFKDRLNIVDGLDLETYNRFPEAKFAHGAANNLLTGRPGSRREFENHHGGGISVDELIARRVGAGAPFRAVRLAHRGDKPYSFSAANDPVTPEASPRSAFETIFDGVSTDTATEEQRAARARRAERRRVLELVRGQLRSVHGRVGAEDTQKIEGHIEAVEQIRSRLDALDAEARESCQIPSLDYSGLTHGAFDWRMYRQVGALQSEIVAAALACDLTRVATVTWGGYGNNGGGGLQVDWLGWTGERGHHALSHDASPEAEEKITQLETWHAEQFASFLRLLDSYPEGDGTLLDNSLVVWLYPYGYGNHNIGNRDYDNLPVVIAGSGGGVLRTGRFHQLGGVPHNQLLLSLCHLMGLDDVTSFGDPELGRRPLAGLEPQL
jgi:hypothetical protein